MADAELLRRYNYDAFVPEKFEPWMQFDQSPPLGEKAPSFPLWQLADQNQTDLAELWKQQSYLVVEFGSFT